MQHILLTINTIENTQLFLKHIEQFQFIKAVELTAPVGKTKKKRISVKKEITKSQSVQDEVVSDVSPTKFKTMDEMMDCFGIWEGRDITQESLRKMAWRDYKI